MKCISFANGHSQSSSIGSNIVRYLVLPLCFFLGGIRCMELLISAKGSLIPPSSCSSDHMSTEGYLAPLVTNYAKFAEKIELFQTDSKESGSPTTRNRPQIPLDDLVNSEPETSCSENFALVEDLFPYVNGTGNFSDTRKQSRVPWVIHMTSKSRCVVPAFVKHIDHWKALDGVEFRLHNDAAMNRLILEKDWPEFPLLKQTVRCMNSMVARADLWRALVIYEYGGIYTDMDNGPGTFHPSNMGIDTDAYFEQERGGFLSQYFFAAAPRHPILFYLVQNICSRVISLPDYHFQYAPMITGPGAMKSAGMYFMGTQFFKDASNGLQDFSKPPPGKYVGVNVTGEDWNLVVVPDATIDRSVARRKGIEFLKMNMTGYSGTDRPKSNESCHHILYEDLMRLKE